MRAVSTTSLRRMPVRLADCPTRGNIIRSYVARRWSMVRSRLSAGLVSSRFKWASAMAWSVWPAVALAAARAACFAAPGSVPRSTLSSASAAARRASASDRPACECQLPRARLRSDSEHTSRAARSSARPHRGRCHRPRLLAAGGSGLEILQCEWCEPLLSFPLPRACGGNGIDCLSVLPRVRTMLDKIAVCNG